MLQELDGRLFCSRPFHPTTPTSLHGLQVYVETTLKCAPETPETFYLLAVTSARANNSKGLYEYLMKACKNADLKAQAKGDREFSKYANTPEFQNIVK